VNHIAFPFFDKGRVVNIKYRALPKHFQQSAKGQQIFYGLDDVQVGLLLLLLRLLLVAQRSKLCMLC
jgi:hypothetical protein